MIEEQLLRSLIRETIRQCGSKWCLYTKDGSRKLGTHDTKQGALDQEKAIHVRGG